LGRDACHDPGIATDLEQGRVGNTFDQHQLMAPGTSSPVEIKRRRFAALPGQRIFSDRHGLWGE
jgi:hypothetical protein